MRKRKVGRPSNKQLRRERNIKIIGICSIIFIVAFILYSVKGFIDSNKLKATAGNPCANYAGYSYYDGQCIKKVSNATSYCKGGDYRNGYCYISVYYFSKRIAITKNKTNKEICGVDNYFYSNTYKQCYLGDSCLKGDGTWNGTYEGNGKCSFPASYGCSNGRKLIGESCYDVKSPSGTSSSGSSSDNNSSGSNSEPAVQGSSGPADYSWLACKVACEKYADSDSQKTCAKSCFASCSPQTDKIKAAQCAKGESTSSNSTSSNSTPAAGSISGSYQGEYGYYSGSTTTSSGEIKLPTKIDILKTIIVLHLK